VGPPPVVASAPDVIAALNDSDAFTPPWIDRVLDALPWVLLGLLLFYEILVVRVVRKGGSFGDYLIWPSGLLAAAIAAFLLRLLNEKTRMSFATIWHRGLIASRHSASPDVAREFAIFLRETQASLNRTTNWLWGIVFVAMFNAAINDRLARFWDFSWIGWNWSLLVYGVATAAALVLGFFAGRMVAIARSIQRLGVRFELNLQGQHPDRSGGFRPLGELCLINALILIVSATHLVIWIWLARGTGTAFVYASMVPVALGLAALAFFRPLDSIHRAMTRAGTPIRETLDLLSVDIDRLVKQQLLAAAAQRTSDVNDLQLKLESVRRMYEENRDIPMWPFDRAILGKFITSMIIPLIGLVTSLGFRIWH
jgi:hypothetical protein